MYSLFFRFTEWIQDQSLPREVQLFCRNVLSYLGRNTKEFMAEDWGQFDDNEEDGDDNYDEDDYDYTRYDHLLN